MESILENIKRNIPSYSDITAEQLKITKFTSATNQVFKVEAPAKPSPIIYRIFGEVPLIPKEIERRSFMKVSASGLGPRCLGVESTFRIEEYIAGTALSRLELSDYANQMAHEISEFHKIERGYGESASSKFIKNWSNMFSTKINLYKDSVSLDRQSQLEDLRFLTTPEGFSEVSQFFPKTETLVFSHMDVSYQNILKSSEKLWIIDYEYTDLAYHAIDLANYINERLFEYNVFPFEFHPEDEMSPGTQHEFVEIYAEENRFIYEDLWNEVCECRAVVNYLGALWAANMFKPQNEYFLDYAQIRFSQYQRFSNL